MVVVVGIVAVVVVIIIILIIIVIQEKEAMTLRGTDGGHGKDWRDRTWEWLEGRKGREEMTYLT